MAGFEHILLLLLVVMGLAPVAQRWDVPLPILAVVAGMALAALPMHPVAFDPELIFLIFVPPLLYIGGLTSSARDLRRHRRAIALLALGCVSVTIVAVAALAHWLVAGLPWSVAFVLGAMVSPPDAAVTLAIARQLGLPRQIVTILEGETLFNDIIAFTVYRLAVAAAVVGTFSWWDAASALVGGVAGGVAIGLGVAWLVIIARRHLPEPRVANTLSLMTPFAAYLPAEWLHASGVMAVVTTGLVIGRVGPRIIPARIRLQAQQMWDVALFILNGLIFVLIGSQLGAIIGRFVVQWDGARFAQVVAISLCVVVVRILWVFPATVIPRLLERAPAGGRQLPPWRERVPWRGTTVVAWTGIRGGDTLVTALALPLTTMSGEPFPGREVIQTLAYGVILATLVVQGLTLRPLIRRCKLAADPAEREEESLARRSMAEAGGTRLAAFAEERKLPDDLVEQLRVHHHLRRHVRSGGEHQQHVTGSSIIGRDLLRINREVLQAERAALVALRDHGHIGDDILRQLQREIDLEEVVMERAAD